MSRPVSYTSAVTINPTGYSDMTFTSSYAQNPQNGCNSSANTSNYARFTMRNTRYTIFYDFQNPEIPQIATINSVSCTVRGYVSNRSSYPSVQLYSNTTAKGSATNITSTASTNTVNLTTGTWTASDTTKPRLYIKVASASNSNRYFYFYGATLTINYTVNGTEYEVSFSNQSSEVTTEPSSTQYVFQGSTQNIVFNNINDLDDVDIEDNGNNIESGLVYVPSRTTSINLNPSSFENVSFGVYVSGATSGYNGTSNTTQRAQFRLRTRGNYAEYGFDTSQIPEDAVIDSVSCSFRAAVSNTGRTAAYQLYGGGAGKSNIISAATTASSTYNLTGGTWTLSDVQSIKLRLTVATGSTNTSYYAYFYGADLTIEYTINESSYIYTISNIAADHTISIEDVGGTFYNVNASSTYTGATVSPSTQSIREGRDADVNISVANLYEIKVKDNNVDVTSSVTGSNGNYTYTVSNVQTAHTITVEENTNYSVTVNSTYTGATGTANPSKVYVGRNSTVNIEVDNLYEIVVKDNGTVVNPTPAQDNTNVSFIPTSFIQSASVYTSIQNTGNGLTNSASTNYCIASAITGSNAESYLVYKFDCSSIPENAVIENVTCAVKGRVSSTTYLPTRYAQLYCGNTAKGNQSGNFTTSDSIQTINGGTWTREELDDINVRMIVRRGTSSTGSTASMRFHGATLVITYSIPCNYTITNIQSNHTITIEEAPYAMVSVVSYYPSTTGYPSSQKVYIGRNATITFTGIVNGVKIKDGNVDVTSSISQNTYTISNVQESHTIYIHCEVNYVKVDGIFKEIKTYYMKVDNSWCAMTKTEFESIITSKTASYGGYFSGITSIGEVSEQTKSITINDGELPSGTYKIMYENENGTPLENYDKITEFTIS